MVLVVIKITSEIVRARRIIFNFPEVKINDNGSYQTQFTKGNFGQTGDMLPLLLTLKKCARPGFDALDIFGLSRGGAAIVINTIGVLNSPIEKKSKAILDKVGITPEQAKIFYENQMGTLYYCVH